MKQQLTASLHDFAVSLAAGLARKLKAARECDMASMTGDKAARGEAQGSRRPRQQAKRSCRVGFSLTGEERERAPIPDPLASARDRKGRCARWL
jgi:hypothetical protein